MLNGEVSSSVTHQLPQAVGELLEHGAKLQPVEAAGARAAQTLPQAALARGHALEDHPQRGGKHHAVDQQEDGAALSQLQEVLGPSSVRLK